jgi:hypothetical protein
MADPRLAIRGDSYTPRRNLGIPNVNVLGTLGIGADAGALSGSLIDMTNGSTHGLAYNGYLNSPLGRAQSWVMRIKNGYSGTPGANRGLLMLGSAFTNMGPNFQLWHATSTGQITAYMKNAAGTVVLNSVTLGVWNPTANTYYDIVAQWTGDTTSNGFSLKIDNALFGSATLSAAMESSWDSNYFDNISVGYTNAAPISNFKLDEFGAFEGVIDTANVALESGNGALNGASRTSLIVAPVFNGLSTNPGAANVKNNVSYVVNGDPYTGTYTGADINTSPPEATVLKNVTWKSGLDY